MRPPIIPIVRLAAGLVEISLTAPIITPPARVAFKISSMLNLLRNRALTAKADKQLPVKDKIVLVIMRLRSNGD